MTAQQRFEAIYCEHAAAVHRYALRRMQPGEAEDIVAEVFLIVWRRLEDVPAEPRGWLLGVARRVVSNRRRSDQRRAALRERVAAAVGGEEAAAGSGQLAQALLSLPEADREALTLIAWDGLSHREAARALGVREGTFAVRLSRARRRLARALAASQEPTKTTTTPLEAR
ncbi:MAG: RNA polymerase sigma factor [Solirubrobacteraceae bacterium]